MKTLLKLSFILPFVIVFFACNDNMGDPDNRLAQVKSLIEPADGKSVILDPAASTTLYFEWDYAGLEEGGTSVYQIAFDKTSGDFSNPIYLTSADNNGFSNYVTLTHKQLNKIVGTTGVIPSETGTLKWTVFSSKGTQAIQAAQVNTISITRLNGFEEENIPIDIYVTGEASEGGTDLSKAHKMKAVASGEFEAYTKLTAGKPFYFVDEKSGSSRQFYTADGLIKEESGTSTVATDGVYRVVLDFTTGACTYTLVTRIGFYFSPSGSILFDLPYVGYGVFQTRTTVTFQQESWGRDERYKFRMFVKENGGADAEKELEWATLNQTDSRPTATSPESYYYMELISNITQWDNKWKLMGDFDDVEATYTIYLTADQPYTHSISK